MIIYLINPFIFKKINISRIGRCVTKAKAEYLYPPTELLSLAAWLRKAGFGVKVIDGVFYQNSLEVKRAIKRPSYFIIMVGIFSYKYDSKFIQWLKKNFPEVPVIVFGQGASYITTDYLKIADYVVFGEPEKPILGIVNKKNTIKGVSYKKGNKVIINKQPNLVEKLDNLPYPARDLIDNTRYQHAFLRPFVMVYSSRGCPFQCTFCTSKGYSPFFRSRSVKNVIGELSQIKNKFKIRNFGFMDETFTVDKQRTIKICQAMIKEKLKMNWIALARVDTVDKKILSWMKKAGCRIISYGIESFDQEVLDSLNKKITIKQIKNAVQITKEAGIEVHGFFILGSPNDTAEKINNTIKEAKNIGLDYASFNTFVPYPGTLDYFNLDKKNLIKTRNWSAYDQSLNRLVFKHPEIDNEMIKKLVKKAHLKFYLDPRFIIKRLIKDIAKPKTLLRDILNLNKIIKNYFL